jgi:hypothetical protein
MKKTKTFLEKLAAILGVKAKRVNNVIADKLESLELNESKDEIKTTMFFNSSLERSIALFNYAKELLDEKIKAEELFIKEQTSVIERFRKQ